jgi:hypothetical protein
LRDCLSTLPKPILPEGGVDTTVVNKSTQPIKNIHVWSSAFMIYASLMFEKFPNKGLEFFKYMHTVRMASVIIYLTRIIFLKDWSDICQLPGIVFRHCQNRYCPREGLTRTTSTTPCRQPPKKSSETWLSEVYIAHHNLPSPRSNP